MEPNPSELFSQFQRLGSAMRFADEIQEIINHAPLFEGLSTQEVNAMCSFMTCFAAPRGGTLIREGSAEDFLLIVLTGSVDVIKRSPDGDTKRVATVGPGTSLGEMSLIDGHKRFATCVADEPVDFAVLTREGLNDILMVHPRLGNKLLLLLLSLFTYRLRNAIGTALPHMAAYAV
jgi:CRP-like cAMP-binding protein